MTDQRGGPAESTEAADVASDEAADELQADEPIEAYTDLIDEPAADASEETDEDAVASSDDLPDEVRNGDIGTLEPQET